MPTEICGRRFKARLSPRARVFLQDHLVGLDRVLDLTGGFTKNDRETTCKRVIIMLGL